MFSEKNYPLYLNEHEMINMFGETFIHIKNLYNNCFESRANDYILNGDICDEKIIDVSNVLNATDRPKIFSIQSRNQLPFRFKLENLISNNIETYIFVAKAMTVLT